MKDFHHLSQPLITPEKLITQLPLDFSLETQIDTTRQVIVDILKGNDSRLLVIAGPCSIHDPIAAFEYAQRLKEISHQWQDDLFIVMRVYFEKPRTTIGWKGLISDPHLDGSFDINHGLFTARKLLLDLAKIKISASTEFLDNIIPAYLSDLISWCAIGARTSESQLHREIASSLKMPVGFKNSTDGNVQIAADAAHVASHSHLLLTITQNGTASFIRTSGNPHCHIILRGGNHAPNYYENDINNAAEILRTMQVNSRVMVDCSHGNSMKDYKRQAFVIDEIVNQKNLQNIFGVMLESNLVAGKQTFSSHYPLVYGQSITDGCLSFDETVPLLEKLALWNSRRTKSSSGCVGTSECACYGSISSDCSCSDCVTCRQSSL